MEILKFFLLLLISFFISNYSLKILVKKSPDKLIDIPNFRSLHHRPIPRGGGIIFVLISVITSFIYISLNGINYYFMVPIISIPLAFIGFLDDLYEIRPWTKYFFQVFTSINLIWFSRLFQI